MRDAVICEPLRTPVGGFGGSLRDVPAARAGGHRDPRPAGAHRAAAGRGRRRAARPLLPDDGRPGDRPGRRAGRRPAGHRHRAADRPPLRVRAAGRAVRGDAGAVRARRRWCWPAARSRCRTRRSTPRRCGGAPRAGPGCCCTTRWPAAGSPRAGSTSRCPAACSRPRRTCAASTRSRAPSRTSSPSARHQRAAAARDDGRFADEIVPVVVKGREGRDGRRHRRAHPRRLDGGEARRRCARSSAATTRRPRSPPGNASGQNDGAAICVVTHPARAAELGLRPLARLVSWGVGGRAAGDHGDRPGAGGREGAATPPSSRLKDIDLIELNEAFAAQVLACTREWELTAGRLRPAQRQRLGHLARAPGRRHRRSHPGDADPRDGPPRRPLRPGDDVHRRRAGPGRGVRADGLVDSPVLPA